MPIKSYIVAEIHVLCFFGLDTALRLCLSQIKKTGSILAWRATRKREALDNR